MAEDTQPSRPSRSMKFYPTRTNCRSIGPGTTPKARSPILLGTRMVCRRDRRVSWYIHSHLDYAAELRPHDIADHPAALGRGLSSHQFQRSSAVPHLQPLRIRSLRVCPGPPVSEFDGIVRPAGRPPGAPTNCITGVLLRSPFPGLAACRMSATSGQIQSQNYEEKPSFNANLTWVKGVHTFQVRRGDCIWSKLYTGAFSGVTLDAVNGAGTGIPQPRNRLLRPFSFNGYNMGFGFASFLLGDYASVTQTPNEFYREGSQEWGCLRRTPGRCAAI
jgi:hypothetical protein